MRYAAVTLVIGLAGIAAGAVVHVRHLLARPVVADDAGPLTADLAMRIQDARDDNALTVLWSLPIVLLFGTAPARWNVAAIGLVVAGLAALLWIRTTTPSTGAAARAATGA